MNQFFQLQLVIFTYSFQLSSQKDFTHFVYFQNLTVPEKLKKGLFGHFADRFVAKDFLKNKKEALDTLKQAGTGPSWRHIQGSKIAKRLPSVKYSLLQYSKIKNFSKNFFRKRYLLKKWTEWGAGAR